MLPSSLQNKKAVRKDSLFVLACLAEARYGQPLGGLEIEMVPEEGIEPTRPQGATDFESAASTVPPLRQGSES